MGNRRQKRVKELIAREKPDYSGIHLYYSTCSIMCNFNSYSPNLLLLTSEEITHYLRLSL